MNVGLLGAGHIARALAEGWALPGERPGKPRRLTFFDLAPDVAAALAGDTGGGVAADAKALVEASDLVVVAVPPTQVDEVLREVAPVLGGRALVSVAAGIRLARLTAGLPAGARVGRVMPNVAAALGLGVVLFAPGTLGEARGDVAATFASAGAVVEIDEADFDAGTAVASCLPGYVARLVVAFAAAGAEAGLDEVTARRLAVAGFHGAAAVVAAAGEPATVLAAMAKPGSMTAAGVAALEQGGIDAAVAAAVTAAAGRATQLARA